MKIHKIGQISWRYKCDLCGETSTNKKDFAETAKGKLICKKCFDEIHNLVIFKFIPPLDDTKDITGQIIL